MTTAHTEELTMWREHAQAWEGVARNMAMVLTNTLAYADGLSKAEREELGNAFRRQCEAHHVTP